MSGNIIVAAVTILGKRPILFHQFTRDALALDRKERVGVPGNAPDEWKTTVPYDPITRQLYVPNTYLFGCLRDGSRYTKKGRSSYITKLVATLSVKDERTYLDGCYLPEKILEDQNQTVYLDVRGVRNPNTRGLNIRYRVACKPGWSCSFHIEWDKTIIGTDVMHAIIIDAGRLVGLGDGRNIGFGRFELSEFRIIEPDCPSPSLATTTGYG